VNYRGKGSFGFQVIQIFFTMEWSNEKNLVASCLNYACCDDILQPYVHKGHDMKLPLSFCATFRMKEFYDYKTEMYHGAFDRDVSWSSSQGSIRPRSVGARSDNEGYST
jgi:hypothetical protein